MDIKKNLVKLQQKTGWLNSIYRTRALNQSEYLMKSVAIWLSFHPAALGSLRILIGKNYVSHETTEANFAGQRTMNKESILKNSGS